MKNVFSVVLPCGPWCIVLLSIIIHQKNYFLNQTFCLYHEELFFSLLWLILQSGTYVDMVVYMVPMVQRDYRFSAAPGSYFQHQTAPVGNKLRIHFTTSNE